jgi:hypothetical protein
MVPHECEDPSLGSDSNFWTSHMFTLVEDAKRDSLYMNRSTLNFIHFLSHSANIRHSAKMFSWPKSLLWLEKGAVGKLPCMRSIRR